jgi:hypothetical protein
MSSAVIRCLLESGDLSKTSSNQVNHVKFEELMLNYCGQLFISILAQTSIYLSPFLMLRRLCSSFADCNLSGAEGSL